MHAAPRRLPALVTVLARAAFPAAAGCAAAAALACAALVAAGVAPAATLACGACGAAPAQGREGAPPIDGISDQGLPPLSGPGATGPLRALVADPPEDEQGPIGLARYVVQWDALAEPPGGAEYGRRLEAWLSDAAAAGLVRVLAPTSYGGAPPAVGEYGVELRATLARARALGAPVAWVEPWNEPNNQGRAPATLAAEYADVAHAVCAELACGIVAGDLEDAPGALSYERAYEAALDFAPRTWGVHPYRSVSARDDAPLLELRAALPPGARLWFTEVAAAYCRRGSVVGEAAQAQEAAYLRRLVAAIDPVHTFYYGIRYADPVPGACGASSGEDTQLFGTDGHPRAAAMVLLGGAAGPLAAFGPAPA